MIHGGACRLPMEALFRVGCFTNYTNFHPIFAYHHKALVTRRLTVSARGRGSPAEDDVLQTFFKEIELNGDFISKAYDLFWQREVTKFVDADDRKFVEIPQQTEQVEESDNGGK